jgi:hypothetical protein
MPLALFLQALSFGAAVGIGVFGKVLILNKKAVKACLLLRL